jgi:hypothetical protein
MRTPCLIVLIVLTLATGHESYAQLTPNHYHPVFNWGIRAGINALSTNFYDVFDGEVAIGTRSSVNNVGYNLSAFTRINARRLLLQPEFAWNTYNQSLSFSIADADGTYVHLTEISGKFYSFNMNILAGYNIIKDGPFLLNIAAGPSVKYIYKIDYEINKNNYTDKEPEYFQSKYSGIIGFAIIISNYYFDIRYEINLPDTDIHLGEIPDVPRSLKEIYIHKNENILNFSFGLIF